MVVVFDRISSMWNFMKMTMVTRMTILSTKAMTINKSLRYFRACPSFYNNSLSYVEMPNDGRHSYNNTDGL
jgi:hypothetical protein